MAAIDFPNSPTNGQKFTASGMTWTYQTGVGWLLDSATATSGGFTFAQDAVPTATALNQTWFQTSTGFSFIWFNDGNSSQWLQFAPGGGGGGSGGGSGFTYTQEPAPTTPVHGATWHDTSTGISYVYVSDVNSSQWVQFAPGGTPPGTLPTSGSGVGNGGSIASGGTLGSIVIPIATYERKLSINYHSLIGWNTTGDIHMRVNGSVIAAYRGTSIGTYMCSFVFLGAIIGANSAATFSVTNTTSGALTVYADPFFHYFTWVENR